MCQCLDEEKQLNAKLTHMLEDETKQRKQREKEFHNKLGEVNSGMKALADNIKSLNVTATLTKKIEIKIMKLAFFLN